MIALLLSWIGTFAAMRPSLESSRRVQKPDVGRGQFTSSGIRLGVGADGLLLLDGKFYAKATAQARIQEEILRMQPNVVEVCGSPTAKHGAVMEIVGFVEEAGARNILVVTCGQYVAYAK